MSRPKRDSEDPQPLNFDHDAERGPVDPILAPSDIRGDDENEQYYQEEEALSPEEAKLRKQEGTLDK